MKTSTTPSETQKISRRQREAHFQQTGTILWCTGLPSSGKTTLSIALEQALFQRNVLVTILDGDVVRSGLNQDLGFSTKDRKENIRRIGEIAKLLADQAFLVIVALISPFRQDRDMIRHSVEDDRFIEVFIDCPLEVCEERDTKGLYKKARSGEISDFTGISSPYEPPTSPEIHIKTSEHSVEECVGQMIQYLERAEVFKV